MLENAENTVKTGRETLSELQQGLDGVKAIFKKGSSRSNLSVAQLRKLAEHTEERVEKLMKNGSATVDALFAKLSGSNLTFTQVAELEKDMQSFQVVEIEYDDDSLRVLAGSKIQINLPTAEIRIDSTNKPIKLKDLRNVTIVPPFKSASNYQIILWTRNDEGKFVRTTETPKPKRS